MKKKDKVGAFGLFHGLSDYYKDKWLFIEEESRKDFWIGIYSLYNLIRYAIIHDLITVEDANVFLDAADWSENLPMKSKEDIIRNL